jgi:antitoxin VapB
LQTIARRPDIFLADKKLLVESAYDYTMALNIKDLETEKLAAEVAELTGESKTGAVREALRQRRDRLALQRGSKEKRRRDLRRFMETQIWPQIPEELRGKSLTKAEREEILGYGPEGY